MEIEFARKLFQDEAKAFPGYWGIVGELVGKHSCISTIHAMNIDFGKVQDFISFTKYEQGVDLVVISLDMDKLKQSEHYKFAKEERMEEIRFKINESINNTYRLEDLYKKYEQMN